MENRPYALSAGLFLLLLCAGLIVVAVKMSGGTRDQIPYVVESKRPVSGLNANAPVRLRGVDVGTVKKIHFSPNDPNLIFIDIAVDRSAPLTKGTFATLNYQGITGLSFVQLDNDPAHAERLVTSAGTPAHIELRPSFLDQVSGSGEELLRETTQAAKRVNTLLSDQNLSEFSSTVSNLNVASKRIADIANDLQPAVKAFPMLVKHTDATISKVDPLLDNLNSLTQEVRTRVVTLDKIGKSADDIGQTSRALEEAVPELRGTLSKVDDNLQMLTRVLSGIEQRPQSLLFGNAPQRPGPGENGFNDSLLTH